MTGSSRLERVSHAPERGSLTDSGAAARATPYRILVVDDDPAIGSSLSELLELSGYAVEVAADGTDAVTRALLAPPDLVVMDVNLPPKGGFEAATSIRSSPEASEIPILFLSAVRDLAVRMRRLAIDDVDFLPKPFGVDELLTRIERGLALARARRKLHRQAERDELTGLGNRRAWEEGSRRPVQAMLDVEGLKWVNDNLGWAAGDELPSMGSRGAWVRPVSRRRFRMARPGD